VFSTAGSGAGASDGGPLGYGRSATDQLARIGSEQFALGALRLGLRNG